VLEISTIVFHTVSHCHTQDTMSYVITSWQSVIWVSEWRTN